MAGLLEKLKSGERDQGNHEWWKTHSSYKFHSYSVWRLMNALDPSSIRNAINYA